VSKTYSNLIFLLVLMGALQPPNNLQFSMMFKKTLDILNRLMT